MGFGGRVVSDATTLGDAHGSPIIHALRGAALPTSGVGPRGLPAPFSLPGPIPLLGRWIRRVGMGLAMDPLAHDGSQRVRRQVSC